MAQPNEVKTILESLKGFDKVVGTIEKNGVNGVIIADDAGVEMFLSLAPILTGDELSGSGKSFKRGGTSGFTYSTDGLGVSIIFSESVTKPRKTA